MKEGAQRTRLRANRWECSLAAGWWRPVSALPAVSRVADSMSNAPVRSVRSAAWLLRRSVHLHHDVGQIVVLLRVANPALHLGGNPRADLVGGQMRGLSEQRLQAFLAELFAL